jgi:transcriptional regulator with XRE-family HTH domain
LISKDRALGPKSRPPASAVRQTGPAFEPPSSSGDRTTSFPAPPAGERPLTRRPTRSAGGAGRLDSWGERFEHALRLREVGKLYALAVEIGVDESAISRWKKGRSISLENAAEVCRALDISLDWLVMGRGSIDAHRGAPPPSEDPAGALVRQAFPDMPPTQAEAVIAALQGLVQALRR